MKRITFKMAQAFRGAAVEPVERKGWLVAYPLKNGKTLNVVYHQDTDGIWWRSTEYGTGASLAGLMQKVGVLPYQATRREIETAFSGALKEYIARHGIDELFRVIASHKTINTEHVDNA